MLARARPLALAAAVSAPVVLGTPAFAAECRGVQFPDAAKAGEADLVLNGLGLRKATFLKVKVYVAGLYVPQKQSDAGQILGVDQAWRLALRFLRDVDGADIHDAFTEGFDKSTGGKAEALKPRIDAVNAFVPDFMEGDRMDFTHASGQGVALAVNDAPKGQVEGADFAAAMLGIWLGPEPPNDELKAGLLGGDCE